jgi:hypothetical protein
VRAQESSQGPVSVAEQAVRGAGELPIDLPTSCTNSGYYVDLGEQSIGSSQEGLVMPTDERER